MWVRRKFSCLAVQFFVLGLDRVDFAQNYFKLFSLPRTYQLDQAALLTQYRRLQKEFHPDNFANKSAGEQRLAMQFASYINTAYQTLKSPLLCAEYLLMLVGEPVDSDALTVTDNAFLMTQMQWRESLSNLASTQSKANDGVADISAQNKRVKENTEEVLALLSAEVNTKKKQFLSQFEVAYQQGHYAEAKDVVAKLHFVEKMQSEIHCAEDTLFY